MESPVTDALRWDAFSVQQTLFDLDNADSTVRIMFFDFFSLPFRK